jgi:hypothetical protein
MNSRFLPGAASSPRTGPQHIGSGTFKSFGCPCQYEPLGMKRVVSAGRGRSLRDQSSWILSVVLGLLVLLAAAEPGQWVFLGSAPTGQAVTVDAGSVIVDGRRRTAWFRLFTPFQVGQEVPAYLLQVDCADRQVNAMAVRHYGTSGTVAEQRDFGPDGEGAAPVQPETATETIYEALCSNRLGMLLGAQGGLASARTKS